MPCPFQPGISAALENWVLANFQSMNPTYPGGAAAITSATPLGASQGGLAGLGYTTPAIISFGVALAQQLIAHECQVTVSPNTMGASTTVKQLADAIGRGLS